MSERALSVTLDYVLMLMIATVVLAGVATVSASLIDEQVERGIEGELETTGESLAGDIQDVERMANASTDNGTVLSLESRLPSHVSGESYSISVDGGTLRLETTAPDVEVTVPTASDRITNTTAPVEGGDVLIVVDGGSIEVREP